MADDNIKTNNDDMTKNVSTNPVKKGDFIEMDFTAKIASTGQVFDTTSEDVAKKNNIYNKETVFKPLIVRAGEGQLVKGLDEFIIGKTSGNYSVRLEPEKAFGKKNAKLLRLISLGEFHKHEIQPVPGLEVELDGNRGIVRTVNGGRVIVDFNHPLSSQEIIYDINIKGIIDDPKIKVQSVLDFYKLPFKNIEISDGKAIIKSEMDFPQEMVKPMQDEIKKITGIDSEFKKE